MAAEWQDQGFASERQKVADLLHERGYSLQANRKTREGSHHPERTAQFEYLAAAGAPFQAPGLPVMSVDPKKKEWGASAKIRAAPGVGRATPRA